MPPSCSWTTCSAVRAQDHALRARVRRPPPAARLEERLGHRGPAGKGIHFTEIDVTFIQRNNQKEMSRLRTELQRILQASAR